MSEFISSMVLHKTETVIVFDCRLVAAIVFLGYFDADLTFHVYFCKKVSEFETKINGPCKVHMWIRFGCRTRNRREIFFSRQSHGTHSDLTSLSSQSSKSVLNDERIVFLKSKEVLNRNVKIRIKRHIGRGCELSLTQRL